MRPTHISLVLGVAAFVTAVVAVGVHSSPAPASAAPTPEQVRFFEAKVRPLLAEKCFGCHSGTKESGGLKLDSTAALLKGGASGPAVVPGSPEKSLLVRAVHHDGLKMPPAGKLKPAEIAVLEAWVRAGAFWPGGKKPEPVRDPRTDFRNPKSAAAKSYWAFQPVRKPPVPAVQDGGWSRTAIDRFVFQRLKAAGLKPAPEADRIALIRRVTFDLTGLPPTPEEVDAFVNDPSTGAYEKVVDRLLASPRYGERWARHWLDLVRYADSDGYRLDEYRPHAWRYRDYVVQAFNNDKPYHRFVQEQLAGDELFPGNPEARIATGYLRHWIYEYNARDVRGQWTTIQNDLTDTTGDVFLGLGLQCARCHDHKFDPILQKDYFRLQAFFAPILPRDDLSAATPEQEKEYAARLAAWEAKTTDLRARIAAAEARARKAAAEGAIIMFPPDIQVMIRKPVAQREPLEHQLAELAYRQVDYEFGRLERHLKADEKENVLALRKQLAELEKDKPAPLATAPCVTDVGPKAPPVYIPKKGKEPVEPGFPTVLQEEPARILALPNVPNSTGRRAALARWLTRPENPLTSRVIVNRVWQYHFGRGLAANASDFGKLGDRPSHPELLDWLAASFVGKAEGGRMKDEAGMGWSLKRLHRLIVTSATYRQSSRNSQSAVRNPQLVDPENRLYWRGNTRRLDAEQIRDAALAVTGELDLKAGGPGVTGGEPRRTIYTRYMRNNRDPLLDVFDLPQFFASASSRDTTTTPVQSLLLINSQTLLLRSKAFAERLEQEAKTDDERIARAYRLAFGRAASAAEIQAAKEFIAEQARRINPEVASSEAAAFLSGKLPFRDGQAALMSPQGPQTRFEVPADPRFPKADFTIETFFLARSVYDSGAVRTLVSRWNGTGKGAGWSFGITGKGSRRKPQTLVIQLWGDKANGSFGEEAIFSDQTIQLNKPYYAGVAVQLARSGQPGTVSFYLKDLSNDDEPLLVAKVSHHVTGGIDNGLGLSIGGKEKGEAHFDGLIDDVRLSQDALDTGQLLFTVEGANRKTVGYWQFEAKPDVFRDASGNGLDIRPATARRDRVDPQRQALADFCHVLLNANGFLYVD